MSFAFLRSTPEGVTVEVMIQPRASTPGIAGEHGGKLKIRVRSPPVEGRANAELIEWFAETLNLSRNRIEIQRGENSRTKLLLLRDCLLSEVEALLRGNI